MKTFSTHDASGYEPALPGITRKTLVYGDRTLMTEFVLQAGRDLPVHAHPFEQTGYLVKGHLRLRIGDTVREAHAGDAWCIPVDVPHGADVVADSVAIEVFSPRRDDYVPAAVTPADR